MGHKHFSMALASIFYSTLYTSNPVQATDSTEWVFIEEGDSKLEGVSKPSLVIIDDYMATLNPKSSPPQDKKPKTTTDNSKVSMADSHFQPQQLTLEGDKKFKGESEKAQLRKKNQELEETCRKLKEDDIAWKIEAQQINSIIENSNKVTVTLNQIHGIVLSDACNPQLIDIFLKYGIDFSNPNGIVVKNRE
jgi:hypothetical protein